MRANVPAEPEPCQGLADHVIAPLHKGDQGSGDSLEVLDALLVMGLAYAVKRMQISQCESIEMRFGTGRRWERRLMVPR